jgi:Uma2 family endonuclease
MSVAASSPPRKRVASPAHAEQRFLIYNIKWQTYDTLLNALGDGHHIRLTYDRGTLELMSPSPVHEMYKHWLGLFLTLLAIELNVRVKACGSTTFRREDLDRGLEPDECFYLANASRVRDWTVIDLTRDPPPDLAIEVDITSSSLNRMGIYAALKVRELWRFDGETLRFYRLGTNQEYEEVEFSPSFPSLPLGQVVPFLHQSTETDDDTRLVQAIRSWIQTDIVPKWQGTAANS